MSQFKAVNGIKNKAQKTGGPEKTRPFTYCPFDIAGSTRSDNQNKN
jgi:hypothetical protein